MDLLACMAIIVAVSINTHILGGIGKMTWRRAWRQSRQIYINELRIGLGVTVITICIVYYLWPMMQGRYHHSVP